MALFENVDRGRYWSQAYDNHLTISSTNVASERVLFSAGLICNKIRSRLSDRSLDALLFWPEARWDFKEIHGFDALISFTNNENHNLLDYAPISKY